MNSQDRLVAGMTRRKKKSPVLAILFSIAAVVCILVGAVYLFQRASVNEHEMDKAVYYGITSDDQAALVVDDTILPERGLVRDGTIYIDYPTVWNSLNSSFYWEPEAQTMLLTLPEGTLSWTPDDGTNTLLMLDGMPYLTADCIRDNSDIDMTIMEEPYRIVARTKWTNIAAERVTQDTVVRNRADSKGEVLAAVKAGDTVVLVENGNTWCRVATLDGLIGYIKKSEFEAAPEGAITHTTDDRFVFPHLLSDKKICLAWQFMQSTEDTNLQGLTDRTVGLNTVSPTWFSFADAEGTLLSFATKEYVDTAHAKGLQVWGCLQDLYGSNFPAGTVLMTYGQRQHVIEQLLAIAEETGMDGINIDIETIEEATAPQYLQFLRELSVAAHEKGLVISSDTYVPIYTYYYNRREQAKTVDYIVLMGYDEHTVGSEEAGSVASIGFVEKGIADALTEVSPEQLINGIPFYTRGWTTVYGEERPQSEAMGMNEADSWAEAHGISLHWDSEVGQNVGSTDSETERYSIWMEDEKSIEEKMKLIERYDLAGVACWRLGLERSSIWEIISKHL